MRNFTTFTLALLTLLVGLAAPDRCAAESHYVNNQTGDDRRDGRSPDLTGLASGPFRTIAKALQVAQRGDRIILAKTKEPYRESVTLQASRHSGLLNQPFILEGNGATLDGSRPIPEAAWQSVPNRPGVFRYQPRFKNHILLYLHGRPGPRVTVPRDATEPPKLAPLQWCLFRGHVYFRVEADNIPAAYVLSATALPVGITLYEARHIQIRNLVVQGFRLDGINAHDSVFDANLLSLKCRGNGRSGISVGGASRVRLEACLIGNNGLAQLRTEGHSRTLVVNCDLIDDDPAAPAVVKQGGHVVIQKAPAQPAPAP
ncbi:MAG: right-handed parallel beta-helix repeat-containing protein [Pirellulaceae bacterium]